MSERPPIRKEVLEFILEVPNELLFGFVEVLLKMMETNEERVYMEVNVEGISGPIGIPIKVGQDPEGMLGEIMFGILTVKNLKIEDFPVDLRPVVEAFVGGGWIQREVEMYRSGRE